jgi:hypothetical protein
MVAMTLQVWLKRKLAEPTTIHGISVLCALGAGLGTWYSTKSPAQAVAATGGAYSFVAIAMHDKSADRPSVEQLMSDAMTAVAQKHVEAMLPQILNDVRIVFDPPAPAAAAAPAAAPATVAGVAAMPAVAVAAPAPAAAAPAAPVQPGA